MLCRGCRLHNATGRNLQVDERGVTFWERFNTRTGGGGGKKCPPPKKMRRHFFSTCSELNYTPCVKISTPGHQRSGHQVRSKSKTGFWLWGCAVATLDIRLVSNLQCFIRSQIPTTCISRILYLRPEVRSISWPHHYKSMGTNSNRSYWMIMRQNHLNPS